jgi:ribosomal protein S18 acetylase RimI-like enzyme
MDSSPDLTFHPFQGVSDYSLMHTIISLSDQADRVSEPFSLEDVIHWCSPSIRFDPTKDLLFASLKNLSGVDTVVGFSRLSWYTGLGGIRLYNQASYLHPDWRQPGIWQMMVRQNEQRLKEMAAGQQIDALRFFQGWATASQIMWISVLESEGYKAVRHFNNMLYRIDNVPHRPMPAGLEIRPVQPEHFRPIWEAQREVVLSLFEVVAENWIDEKYESWQKNSSHTPELWQVAWDGDQVAGMVLNRIDHVLNQQLDRKRGYTEHIFVGQPWRNRGLAGALLAKSLQVLKAQGMQEAELGVDTENESGAYGFYQRMGYQTFSTDTWFRKPMM